MIMVTCMLKASQLPLWFDLKSVTSTEVVYSTGFHFPRIVLHITLFALHCFQQEKSEETPIFSTQGFSV